MHLDLLRIGIKASQGSGWDIVIGVSLPAVAVEDSIGRAAVAGSSPQEAGLAEDIEEGIPYGREPIVSM